LKSGAGLALPLAEVAVAEEDDVTQQAVERALGKLLTDEAFRERFFASPAQACWEVGLSLSPVELEALSQLSRDETVRFGGALDQRISRPSLDPTGRERRAPLERVTPEEAL
jgi:Ribosomally synthesized peptide prototyped by Frankia Franean1_4349.